MTGPAAGDRDTAAAILAILTDGSAPAESRVRALVAALDLAAAAARQADRDHGFAVQALARAVAAAGRPLLKRNPAPTVAATLAAARAYATAPGDETDLAYFECATSSYPYGSGEGHYGIETQGCQPGSGCTSGAGTLYFAACEAGFDVVICALTAELTPWLREQAAGD
jgi:hypothetical protein